jgi:hypothetical protein
MCWPSGWWEGGRQTCRLATRRQEHLSENIARGFAVVFDRVRARFAARRAGGAAMRKLIFR